MTTTPATVHDPSTAAIIAHTDAVANAGTRSDQHVPRWVDLKDGTRVRLYRDSDALHAAYEAIRHASRRICLEVYIFAADPTGRAFAELLAEKARQGVAVYVLYDAFGSWNRSGEMMDKMHAAGVRLRKFHPLNPWETAYRWRPLNRDHRKLLIIDDEIAGLGGLNIGSVYAGSSIVKTECCDRWRDNGVGVVGPGARLLLQSFLRTWQYAGGGGRIGRAQFMQGLEGELGVLASVPTVDSPLRPLLHELIAGARRSIDLTMAYFAPDDDLIDALCNAANRGVRLRLMLPGACDVRFLQVAARSFYELLLSHGAEIYELQKIILHAKTLVIDGSASVVGSTNLDYRSIEYNLELSLVIRSADFARELGLLFEEDIASARQIHLNQWRSRPRWDRLVQWAVSRARYLL